jgi:hypothetical protein
VDVTLFVRVGVFSRFAMRISAPWQVHLPVSIRQPAVGSLTKPPTIISTLSPAISHSGTNTSRHESAGRSRECQCPSEHRGLPTPYHSMTRDGRDVSAVGDTALRARYRRRVSCRRRIEGDSGRVIDAFAAAASAVGAKKARRMDRPRRGQVETRDQRLSSLGGGAHTALSNLTVEYRFTSRANHDRERPHESPTHKARSISCGCPARRTGIRICAPLT